MQLLRQMIQAVVRAGEESGFVAECTELAVVTQGKTLDETIANLREAVDLHLEGEDLAEMGLSSSPTLVVAMEVQPIHA